MPVKCPKCRAQSLAVNNNRAACTSCGYRAEGKEAAEEWVASNFGISKQSSDKVKRPVFECPDCSVEALVDLGAGRDASTTPAFFCFSCGRGWEKGELECCPECNRLQPSGKFEELIICRSSIGFYVCSDCYLKIFRS